MTDVCKQRFNSEIYRYSNIPNITDVEVQRYSVDSVTVENYTAIRVVVKDNNYMVAEFILGREYKVIEYRLYQRR